jgi:hypothetical protein
MFCKVAASLLALTLLSATVHAGSAPKELYGKSITVRWSETYSGTFKSDGISRSMGSAVQFEIYVSSAGRPFARETRSMSGAYSHQERMGGAHVRGVKESSPESNSAAAHHINFSGHTIEVLQEFTSGAGRLAINVEPAGNACSASVIVGKQAGSQVIERKNARGPLVASSIEVGAVSCAIREGNVFGGQ